MTTRFPIDGTSRLATEREHPTAVLTGPVVTAYNGGQLSAGGIDVWGSQSNPGSVTDWGSVINALIAAGHAHLYFGEHAFPFSTQIDASSTVGLQFEGPAGSIWPSPHGNVLPGYLLWKGSGTTRPVTAFGSYGFRVKGLGCYWDNSGGAATFNGFFNLAGPSASFTIEYSDIRSYQGLTNTAKSALSLNNAVGPQVIRNGIGCAQWGVRGVESGGISNAVAILGNTFDSCAIAHIGNIGQGWTVDDNNRFELEDQGAGLGGTPAVVDSDVAHSSQFDWGSNWVGDAAAAATSVFQQRSGDFWEANFDGGFYGALPGPVWNLQGQGNKIRINPHHVDVTSDPIIDCGVTTGPGNGAYKSNIEIHTGGMTGTGADTPSITNIANHGWVDIDGGGQNAVINPRRRIAGQKQIFYRHQHLHVPTVVAHSGAGVNAPPHIYGTDIKGFVQLDITAGPTAGLQADITFAEALLPPSEYPYAGPLHPIVHVILSAIEVTDIWTTSVGPGANASGLGWYASVNAALTGWSLGCALAPPASKSMTVCYEIAVG